LQIEDLDDVNEHETASHVTPSKQKQNIKISAFIAVGHIKVSCVKIC